MPLMKISPSTMQLVRARRPSGFDLAGRMMRLDDGSWLVPASDQVAVAVAAGRVRGESDDGVVSRLLCDWTEVTGQPALDCYPSFAARQSL
jgi:hypothetical protein